MSQQSRRVGLVSPLPPQIGGVAAVAEWLLSHQGEFGVEYDTFDLHRPAGGEIGGRLAAAAVLHQARLFAGFLSWVPRAPSRVHYAVAATRTGLVRDILFLAILRFFGRKVVAHVHVVDPDSRYWRFAIRVVGRLTSARAYKQAGVFCLPEGRSAMAVLEAMVFGLPVVMTPVRGIADVVRDGETGFLVQPGDPKGLADVQARLIADPERARGVGARARAEVLASAGPAPVASAWRHTYEVHLCA